jgi:hypothetical protein
MLRVSLFRMRPKQVPKDEVAAVEILTKCSKMGDPLGCHLLSGTWQEETIQASKEQQILQ